MKTDDTPRTIQSVQRACNIITLLERDGPMGVTTLASRLDVSKGTVHTHLATLVEGGYITRSDGEYKLSLRYLRLAERVKDGIGIYDLVRDRLDDLSSTTGERAQFTVLEDNRAVCVARSSGEKAIRSSLQVGEYAHLHCIAAGKAMLACFPEERVDTAIETHGLPKKTDNTITTREELDTELAAIRERGYAIDNEERVRGIRCLAAPIRDDSGGVRGAISISGPVRRMDDEAIEAELRDELLRTINIIEVNAELS
ncbi:IclR family transcriptional regulator [Natribaculum luteum]|uniref:IclR family transcriptional regulator n=1 Tax=Natribaculum luteum TaxID=1586232 RepID=A0ABD5NVF2_9EURY|nr:IclR family transcriptional regulator [Natribaculum luteum]